MHPVIAKTFGGLPALYYIRQFPFGFVTPALIVFVRSQITKSPPMGFGLCIIFAVNTLLYPYSRFVYERIAGYIKHVSSIKRVESWFGDYAGVVGYIVGGIMIYVGTGTMLLVKLMIIAAFWSAAIFIAPIVLIYLYIHNSRSSEAA